MTYYIHRNGIIRKTWLRILNAFIAFMIPIEACYWMKKLEEPYSKSLKEEIEIWKEGFKFGK